MVRLERTTTGSCPSSWHRVRLDRVRRQVFTGRVDVTIEDSTGGRRLASAGPNSP